MGSEQTQNFRMLSFGFKFVSKIDFQQIDIDISNPYQLTLLPFIVNPKNLSNYQIFFFFFFFFFFFLVIVKNQKRDHSS